MTISRAQRGHRLRHRSSRNVASDDAPWLLLARRGSRRICVDLVAASALVCISVLASLPLALALHPGTAGPRHGSSPALITLTPRPLSSACRARFMCSAPMFRAWRSLPLTCVKLLVDLCVRDELAASVRVCCTSAAFVELLFRGWRAVAFPRWLHVLSCSCSTCLIFMVRCYFGGLCFDFIDAIVASGELCARVSEALLALPSQALLLPRHLEMTNGRK